MHPRYACPHALVVCRVGRGWVCGAGAKSSSHWEAKGVSIRGPGPHIAAGSRSAGGGWDQQRCTHQVPGETPARILKRAPRFCFGWQHYPSLPRAPMTYLMPAGIDLPRPLLRCNRRRWLQVLRSAILGTQHGGGAEVQGRCGRVYAQCSGCALVCVCVRVC